MLVHPDDLAGMDDRDVGRQRAAMRADRRLVTDEDDLVLRVGAGMVERARDDLGRTVIAAHRVDRDADPGAARCGPAGLAARSPRQRAASSAAGLGWTARRPW